jgi:hypothetical protein
MILENLEYYVNQGLSTTEIAKIYNVHRTTILNKIKKYKIKININDKQKELIIGSLLGDACIVKRKNKSYFRISHCEKQKDYLLYKKEILNNIVRTVSKHIDKRGNSTMYSFNTLSFNELNYFKDLFYKDNVKVINNIGEYLTPFSLAIWYMDDGSKVNKSCKISTESFSYTENQILQSILKNKFNLDCKILKYKKYYYLFFNVSNTIKFHNLIKEYIVDCMKYKLV